MAYFNCMHCGGFGCVFCDLRSRIDRAQGDALDRFLTDQAKSGLFEPASVDRIRQDPALRVLLANAIVHGQKIERNAQTKPLLPLPALNPHRFDMLEVRDDAEEGEGSKGARRRKQTTAAGTAS